MKLVINDLCKQYRNGIQALDRVSLSIETGMFGLLGPNGAGKSTLLRTIATLQEADSGTITFDSIDVLKEREAVRKVLGYLPQEFGLYPKVSARRLLLHFATLKGITPRNRRVEVCDYLLEKTNLYSDRHRRLGGFSGGMKRRFGIAVALIGSPKLIIVDEPTAGLDPEERFRFHNLLCDISENVVVVLSTHIVSDVRDLCTRMAVLNQGRIVLDGNPTVVVDELAGTVWTKTVDNSEVERHSDEYKVISTRLFAGRTILHVHSEDRPDQTFEPIDGDLQDVYFLATRDNPSTAMTE